MAIQIVGLRSQIVMNISEEKITKASRKIWKITFLCTIWKLINTSSLRMMHRDSDVLSAESNTLKCDYNIK